MKIVKPLKLSLLHKAYRQGAKRRFVVSPLLFFRLGESPAVVAENEAWPLLMSALANETVFDMAMPKLTGELLLAATAYARQGQPCQAMDVSVQLGGIDKTLTVVGDRRIGRDGSLFWQVSEPEPFTHMPIGYERSFGGADFGENQRGTGYLPRSAALQPDMTASLPNVQYPGIDYRRRGGARHVAGFGPLDLRSPGRQKLAGTYDRQWLEHDHPGYARDLDWRLFNVAPEDQQIEGFFAGGETYRLTGLHPERPVIEGRLPELTVRCFVQQIEAAGNGFFELPTVIDTVWLLPDMGIGVLVYRGQIDVTDSDALDLEGLMIAYENTRDDRRSFDYYASVWRLRTDPDTALAHVFNEGQLSPQKTAAELEREKTEWDQAQADALAVQQQAIDDGVAEFCEANGVDPQSLPELPKAEPGPLSAIPDAALARGDVDLSKILDEADEAVARVEAQRAQHLAELEQAREGLEPPPGTPQTPDVVESDPDERLERAREVVLGETGAPAGHIAGDDPAPALLAAEQAARYVRAVSADPVPPDASTDGDIAIRLRQLFVELRAGAETLAGRDFAGADLSGLDLSGADLHETMLEGADLGNCNLVNCNLEGAVLAGAQLGGADLSGAKLGGASLASARGSDVRLVNCDLANANLMKCEITDSDFSGSRLADNIGLETKLTGSRCAGAEVCNAMFIDADLAGTRWSGASLERTMILNSTLSAAAFDHTTMKRCVLVNAVAPAISFTDASLDTVQFAGQCDLGGARFGGALATGCGFRKADMNAADLGGATMARCDFGDVDLSAASLTDACLYQSILYGTDLTGSDLTRADLHDARLTKTDLSGADLSDANLYGASVAEPRLKDTVLRGLITDNDWVFRQ